MNSTVLLLILSYAVMALVAMALIVSSELQLRKERRLRIGLQAQLTVSEGCNEMLKAQLSAAPSKECQTWIDRWAQSVKDHKASHEAAERFLMERNQLQNALDRIEYAATAPANPSAATSLADGTDETEPARVSLYRLLAYGGSFNNGVTEWLGSNGYAGLLVCPSLRCRNVFPAAHTQVCDLDKMGAGIVTQEANRLLREVEQGSYDEVAKEFRGGCMGHA